MRDRTQPLDLTRGHYYVTAIGHLVEVHRAGVDLHGEPLFSGGPNIYSRTGDMVCVDGRRDDSIFDDDLVAEYFQLDDHEVSTEVSLEVGQAVCETYVLSELADLEAGEELTVYALGEVIDAFLARHPRFARFRRSLIRANLIWSSGS